jgi:hypothetical protein
MRFLLGASDAERLCALGAIGRGCPSKALQVQIAGVLCDVPRVPQQAVLR